MSDFLSDKDQGKRQPPVADLMPLWDGLSVMDTEDRARKLAQRYPAVGAFLAAVVVDDGGSIRYERTLRRSGHYTLWGDATDLLSRVQLITPV